TNYQSSLGQYVSSVVYDDTLPAAANMQSAILHEIGHALGLKHPGYYGSGDVGPFLPAAEDKTSNTIMSYHIDSVDALQFVPYDIEALTYLYGAPITAASWVGQASGALQRMGGAGNELFALNSYEIWSHSNSTTFTNSGNGYRASETMLTIDGSAGTDQVYIPLDRAQVDIARSTDGRLTLHSQWSVTLTGGAAGSLTLTDQLINIERLHFDDLFLALDTGGLAGQAYGLIYAALDAPPAPDLLGIWLQRFDAGLTGAQVATEIIQTYAPGLPSATLVGLLYHNIVGFDPTPQALHDLVALIDQGTYTQGEFYAAAAALDLNTDQFVTLIGQGITYTI
ncbi:MAG: hypothetical protein WCL44_15290, partial [bacterium]